MTADPEDDSREERGKAASASADLIVRPGGGLRSASQAPLFLHSSFRTGSTWLWEKIRSAPTTYAYYEIFNEALASLTPAGAKHIDFTLWDSRHPATPPYFLEFIPLLRPGGGVAGFDETMAYASFVPSGGPGGDLSAAEDAYVGELIATARLQGRIPVVSCTRSLARAEGCRRSFGGRTILLVRNLFHQWASYCSQAEAGNLFFIDTIRLTMEAAAHDPFLRELSTWFDVADRSIPREALFEVFVLMHLYVYGFAFDASDLVVDLTEIATDATARRRAEHALSELIQHPLDLSDIRHVCELPEMGFAYSKKTRDAIEQFAKLVPVQGRSPESLYFVERLKQDALDEWERFEFFNRGTRTVLTGRIAGLEAQLEEREAHGRDLQADAGQLRAEVDRLRAEAARLQAEAGPLRADADQLRAEVDGLRAESERMQAEADRLRAEAGLLRADAGQLRDEADRLDAESRGTRAEADELRAEGERLRHEMEGLNAEKERLGADADDLRAEKQKLVAAATDAARAAATERESLVQRIAEADSALCESAARLAAVTSERDAADAEARDLAARHGELERALAAERHGSVPQRIWRLVATQGGAKGDR